MGLPEALELEKYNIEIAKKLQIAGDRLNDCLMECARAGLFVDIELIPVHEIGEDVGRSIIVLRPSLVIRY